MCALRGRQPGRLKSGLFCALLRAERAARRGRKRAARRDSGSLKENRRGKRPRRAQISAFISNVYQRKRQAVPHAACRLG